MELDYTPKHRLDVAFFQIIELDAGQRRDLMTMWRPAKHVWSKMDAEAIACRKQNKLTPTYRDLAKDLDARLEMIEQYITFATLLTK
jgi:hypothetical protein